MLTTNLGKVALIACAAAGFALFSGPAPSNAASPSYCTMHARSIATHRVPVGSAGYAHRFRRAYDTAYADCRGGRRMGALSAKHHLAMAPAPKVKAKSKCQNFETYSSSYYPALGETC